MKRTNKQKNSIILVFVITLIIFLTSIFYIIYSIIPSIQKIEGLKESLILTQSESKSIKKIGLLYSEFKKLSIKLKGEDYLNKLLKKINEDKGFYEKNFINKGNLYYYQFLKNKDINITKALKKSSTGLDKDIKKILPKYSSEFLSYGKGEFLTDFKFINYLEKLFNGFNLEYKGSLGINNIQTYYKGKGDLDSSIYSISLNFNLDGKKKDVIDFIHYFENVGYIKSIGGKLSLQKDSFISNNIQFSGDNIYNNQLADISYIKIPKYLDSSFDPRGKTYDKVSFTSFIKNDKKQSNEKININIGIRFYTRGIENYIIKKQINLIITNFNDLSKSIIKRLKDPKLVKSRINKKILLLNKLKKLNTTISGFKKEVSLIRKKINKKGVNLNLLYKEAIKYDKIINNSLTLMGEIIYVKKVDNITKINK